LNQSANRADKVNRNSVIADRFPMAPLHRKFRKLQLRQIWLRDPNQIVAQYREALAGTAVRPLQGGILSEEMIEAILDREIAEHSAPTVMRAIAA
jgi:hypothetical protein